MSKKMEFRRFFQRWKQIFRLTFRDFLEDRCFLYASSLTFYTLMALVPILTVFLAIAHLLHLQDTLEHELLTNFSEHALLLSELIQFAKKALEHVTSGVIASYSLLLLLWSALQLFRNMESAFNSIWKVEKSRSWKRVATDYLPLMCLGPILYLLASSVTVLATKELVMFIREYLGGISPYLLFFVRLIPSLLFWALFTFLYLFIPNKKVRFSSAVSAAFLTMASYLLLQKGYFYFQMGISRYGAIYGSFAALPLFLIWVDWSWVIVLLGGKLSRAHQEVS